MSKVLSPIESEFATEEEAEAYDRWFRAKVEHSLQLADDPNTRRISHDEVMAEMRQILEEGRQDHDARRVAT